MYDMDKEKRWNELRVNTNCFLRKKKSGCFGLNLFIEAETVIFRGGHNAVTILAQSLLLWQCVFLMVCVSRCVNTCMNDTLAQEVFILSYPVKDQEFDNTQARKKTEIESFI